MSLGLGERGPGAKAPFLGEGLFVGLKPHANPGVHSIGSDANAVDERAWMSWVSLRYGWGLVAVLTVCLLFAEHHGAQDMHGEVLDRAFISAERSGQVPREIAYVVLGGLGLLGILRTRGKLVWNWWLAGALGLLVGWAGLSVVWSDTPGITVKRLGVVVLMSVGAVGLGLSWTKEQVLRFIAVSAALQVAVGVVAESVYGYFTPWQSDYRFGGTLRWNQQGYLCMAAVLAGMCVREAKYRWVVGFGLVFLLLTRSRGSLIGLGIGLAFWFVLVMKPKGRVAAVLVGGTLVAVMLMTGVGEKVVDGLNRKGEGAENLTGRAPLWDELMTYVVRRPMTGYGYEGFWTDTTIDDVSDDQHWSIDAAHSGYVESLLTLGYVGVVLHTSALVVGMVCGLVLYWRTRELVYFLGGVFCCIYLAGGYLESVLLVKPSPISFFVAMLVGLMAVKRVQVYE